MTLERDVARELAESRKARLVAPAGHGKTHAIAAAVKAAAPSQGRQLVLTHTHAGVHSLRAKLDRLGVPRAAYRLDTIAGWCLRYCASYPKASGLATLQPKGDQWHDVYLAAARLLGSGAVRDVVLASYGGVFVDEYQDCQADQHAVVLGLADLLRCRVLGDPLQCIFDFRGEPVDMHADLEGFRELPPLDVPHRWLNANSPALAEWLAEVRRRLQGGEGVDLDGAPVGRVGVAPEDAIAACRRIPRDGTAVAIHAVDAQAHALARRLGGAFGSMEEIECKSLASLAASLDGSSPFGQATALIGFIGDCMTKTKADLAGARRRLEEGRAPHSGASSKARAVVEPLAAVAAGGGAGAMAAVLVAARRHPGARLFRRELFDEALRTLRSVERGSRGTFAEAAWHARDHTRQIGRKAEDRAVSRTLLIKGLEYDHALVLQADGLNRNHLYVALTRATRTLAVQSRAEILLPSPPKLETAKSGPRDEQRTLFDEMGW